jgi:hypothetical protein
VCYKIVAIREERHRMTMQDWNTQLELFEREKKAQSEQVKAFFDNSRTYNAVIMGLAYGGFFSLWSSANGFSADKRTLALAGALMTISLIAFILFTVLNMVVVSRTTIGHARLAQQYGAAPTNIQEFAQMTARVAAGRESLNAKLQSDAARMALLWPPFLWTSLASGLVASLLLLWLLLKHHGVWLF